MYNFKTRVKLYCHFKIYRHSETKQCFSETLKNSFCVLYTRVTVNFYK